MATNEHGILVGTTSNGQQDVYVPFDVLTAEQENTPEDEWPTADDWAADFNGRGEATLVPHGAPRLDEALEIDRQFQAYQLEGDTIHAGHAEFEGEVETMTTQHQQITLTTRYNELMERDMWVVRVVDADDSNEEGYSTLDEALAYIKDVAERPLRDVPWSDILTTDR